MGLKRTDEFLQDTVRIALTSRLTRKQVADDLGVGMSKLNNAKMQGLAYGPTRTLDSSLNGGYAACCL